MLSENICTQQIRTLKDILRYRSELYISLESSNLNFNATKPMLACLLDYISRANADTNKVTVRLACTLLLHYLGLISRLDPTSNPEIISLIAQSHRLAASLYGSQWGLEKLYFLGMLYSYVFTCIFYSAEFSFVF